MADLSEVFGAAGFDANSVEPNTGGERKTYPAGEYMMQIVDSELKDNSGNNGKHVAFTMDILSGEYAGQRYTENLSLVHDNQQVVEIAQRAFSGLCRAVGVLNARNTEALHFKPFMAYVTKKPDKNDPNKFWNNIRTYSSANDGGQGQQRQPMPQGGGMPQQAQRPAAPSGQPAAPWQRRA